MLERARLYRQCVGIMAVSTLPLLVLLILISAGAIAGQSGQATYYTVYVPSACYGFDQSQFPPGPLIAAASGNIFSNRAACGHIYDITCKGAASGGANPCTSNPTVRVKVVDLCPGCNSNSFDLSQQAFSRIANTDAGRITISAQRVSINVDDGQIAQVE